jgi:hypothetical protein
VLQGTQYRSNHMCRRLSDTDSAQCITPKHKSTQIKSNQIKSKSNQIKSNQLKSNQIQKGDHRSPGVCTRRQSDTGVGQQTMQCTTVELGVTLRRRPPSTVAMPKGTQHWGKHRVQCCRLSVTAACQDTSFSEGVTRQEIQYRSKHMCCGYPYMRLCITQLSSE